MLKMKDKTCLVTGANSGIGKACTLLLAEQGATVVMICRNKEKGRAAMEEIKAQTGNERVDLLLCDLSSGTQIREVVKEYESKYEYLDILINNAGFLPDYERVVAEGGLEMTFTVNHVAYFMLTNLLIDPLITSPNAKVINVSSFAHYFATFEFDNTQLVRRYTPFRAYANSKLLNIYFTVELARRLEGSTITTNCIHPGNVSTNFGSEGPRWFRKLYNFGRPFLISPEKAAKRIIRLATDPKFDGVSGKYINKTRIRKPKRMALNPEQGKKVWDLTTKWTNMKDDIV